MLKQNLYKIKEKHKAKREKNLTKKEAKNISKSIISKIKKSNKSSAKVRVFSKSARIDYGELCKRNGFKALGTTKKEYRKKIRKLCDVHDSTCRRAFDAAENDVLLGLAIGETPEYLLRELNKTDEADRKEVWKSACKLTTNKYPTQQEIIATQAKFSSKSHKQKEKRLNKKQKMDAKRAFGIIKKWEMKTHVRRVIRVLDGKESDSRACISIIKNLSEDDRIQLVKQLKTLPLAKK